MTLSFQYTRVLPFLLLCAAAVGRAQESAPASTLKAPDPVAALVDQLNLERYKATIKALTQFGDRRQDTDRNRAAADWIETQLKSYGGTNTERIRYDYQPPLLRSVTQVTPPPPDLVA